MSKKFAIACIVLFVLIGAGGLYASLAHLGWYIKAHEANSVMDSVAIVEGLESNGYLTIGEDDPAHSKLVRDISDIADTSMHMVNFNFMAHLWLALGGLVGCILCIVGFCLSLGTNQVLNDHYPPQHTSNPTES